MDNSDYIGELRRRLSPVVFSSALRSESGVELRVAVLTEDDEINLLIEAEERGVALTIQVVGFSLADQRDLMKQIRALKGREPELGIDLVTVHFDGRVWRAPGTASLARHFRPSPSPNAGGRCLRCRPTAAGRPVLPILTTGPCSSGTLRPKTTSKS